MRHEEKNIGGGAENPGSDEQKVSLLLAGLERVEAPKDFDFHLKARIANARPADYRQGSLIPILRYVMPLALFLVVGAGILVNNSYNPTSPMTVDGSVQPSEESTRADMSVSASPVEPLSSPEGSTPDHQPIVDSGILLASQPRRERRRGADDVSLPEAPISTPLKHFSKDSTVKTAPTPIVPPEFRQNTNTSSNSSTVPSEMAPKPMSVRDALGSIGIEAELVETKWKVRSVKSSTIAGQMGVKAGDVLESVDGREIDDKTEYKDGSFKVKTIRVKRGSSAVDLQMPKPQR